MADGLQQRDPTDCSPRKLMRKIESCIFRNALNEEERAQKALYLLRTRDYQIAFLEKRVAELEAAAADLHEIVIQQTSRASSITVRNKTSSDKNEESCKTENDDETDEKTDPYVSSNDNLQKNNVNGNCDVTVGNRVFVPRLKLSKSSTSNSGREIFSTAIDFVVEKKKCLTPDTTFSFSNENSEKTIEKDEKFREKSVNHASETKEKIVNNRKTVEDLKEKKMVQKESEIVCENKSDKKSSSTVSMEKNKENVLVASDRKKYNNLPRSSSSVPWIRAKHCYRKKLRGSELKTGRRFKELPVGDGHMNFAAFG
ncbi:PREDICTED: uncharacterized protein LOC108571491 [Habropoda laboriosa]|uniref:uncharacterized protein LOC108571491 n=1 Tax=Habropoda laboriosa TaxID=597456 RepID=UPI00083E0146|nr:PREDICTED: uncharacterized protein LOC108571491 [Habropoda laboriosa]